jgi:hypothetical protein
MEVVSTRKKRQERAPSTLRKVVIAIESPLLNIDHVNQGSWISSRVVPPDPKNKAKKMQLSASM